MAQRIRYFQQKDGKTLKSNELRSGRGALYQVTIDLENNSYYIRNIKNKSIIRSTEITEREGRTFTLRTVKTQVKKRLKELGVNFDVEVRNR